MARRTLAQLDRDIEEALAGRIAGRPMAEDPVRAIIEPPQRVEILKAPTSYRFKWKPGQFAYAVSYTTEPGSRTVDRREPSVAGELVYGVAKNKDFSTGVSYFSADALRFTRVPRDLIAALSDEEKVALDLIMAGRNETTLSSLVPDPKRRAYVRAIAAQLQSLRSR